MESEKKNNHIFTGNIYIFHAFDVADEIDLDRVSESQEIIQRPYTPPKYFKKYHIPLSIDLPHPHTTSKFESCKIHNFGAISLTYKIPFEGTLESIREQLPALYEDYQEESVINASSVYKKIQRHAFKPKFFHT